MIDLEALEHRRLLSGVASPPADVGSLSGDAVPTPPPVPLPIDPDPAAPHPLPSPDPILPPFPDPLPEGGPALTEVAPCAD